jgi:cold shock protein
LRALGVDQSKVRWSAGRGFVMSSICGDIHRPDDGTADVLVHHSAIQTDGFRSLEENQRVEYTAGQGAKGQPAEQVSPI